MDKIYLYVNKIIPGFFVEYDEPIDEEYWKGQIGETYEDFEAGKWVLLTDEQAAFHNSHSEATVRQVMESPLEYAKEQKIAEIDAYDSSSEVNSFTIGGNPMWLTVEERQQLATQISANESVGRTEMTKWFGGHSFTFPIATWRQMLTALEVYAGDALNVTESHKAAVMAMTTIEEVEAYDITQGYPEKINFDTMFANAQI